MSSILNSLRCTVSLRTTIHYYSKHHRMWQNCLLFVFLNTKYIVYSINFDAADIDAEAEWNSIESFADDYQSDMFMPTFKDGWVDSKSRPPLKLPASVRIPASKLHKDLFRPEKGTIPMPPLVHSILRPVLPDEKPERSRPNEPKNVEVLCNLDRIYVRVLKSLFTSRRAHKHLKLGTCAVNKATDTHYYFLYHLEGCDIKRGEDASRVTYTNTLHYRPIITGMITRELPFSIFVRCNYAKFRRSYQTGFLPKILGGTSHRALHTRPGPKLYVMDESWNLLEESPGFVIGKPVCFEAKSPRRGHQHHQLYLNRCYVTSSPNPFSRKKYNVVENYGCLVDSKNSSLTKFFISPDKTVRFCLAAFVFKSMDFRPDSKKTKFMHCELNFGPQTPTPSAKSCMYDAKTKTWMELYGDDSVCDCCENTCPAPPMESSKSIITSKSWNLDKDISEPMEFMPEFSSGNDDFELFWELDD